MSPRLRVALLWVGLGAGVALVLAGLVRPRAAGDTAPPQDAAALVDGVPIPADTFYTALAGLAVQERGPALTPAQRRRVLDDLITGELLLARALALDLPRAAPIPRRHLLKAMHDLITAEAQADPGEAELRRYYEEHPEELPGRKRYRVRAMFFRGDAEPSRRRAAQALAAARAGEPFDAVARRLADRPTAPLPDGALPASTLRNYLGPTATRTALALRPGGLSEPIRVAGGHRVLKLVAVSHIARPPFEQVRDTVADLVRRKRDRERLRRYVTGLRGQADVVINEALLQAPIPDAYLRAARERARSPRR